MRDYAKVTRAMDDNVGRLMDYLREHDMLDNTLVIYTSDQGFYMGEHGWFDKRFMYEESLRTPLLIAYPGHIQPGTVCNKLVQNIDYAPTFLDLAGISKPKELPGRSLTPIFKAGDKVKGWRNSIYYHYYDYPTYHMVRKHDGVRTDRYKLIHFYNDIDTWELYDLQEDPTEMHNLYGKSGYEKLTKKLHKQLDKLQKKYDVRPEDL